MKDIKLPPLPEQRNLIPFSESSVYGYCEADMLSYARAAVDRASLEAVPDADEDYLTIAYMHGFAKGKDAALSAAPAHPVQQERQPMTDGPINQAIDAGVGSGA